MTPKQEAALRLAVDAWFRPGGINYVDFKPYMDALREALAEQPAQQQEPVCNKDPRGCWSVRCQLGNVCKNTSPTASKQELVAWVERDGELVWSNREAAIGRNLYISSQPSKPWVGLTDEERIMCRSYDPEEAVAKTEAKLKEKNT